MKLQGIFVAAATPFDYDGEIYEVKVQHNIEKWSRTSITGYLFAGLSGEGPLLRDDEKTALWEIAAKAALPGKLLLADVSAEGVHSAAALARNAGATGFHAVVSRTPGAHIPGARQPETSILFFRSLADRSPLPLLIDNASRTAPGLSVQEILLLTAHPNIAGVIDSGISHSGVVRIRQGAGREFGILCSSASDLWLGLQSGANGAVLALASAAPYACITLWEAFRMRESEAGEDWQSRIALPQEMVAERYGVPGLKHAMELNGYYGGPPRLPYCPSDAAARVEIEAAFRDLRG